MKKAGIKIRSGVRAGQLPKGLGDNHNQTVRRIKVRSGVRAGQLPKGLGDNHNLTRIR
jgi:hypothetical protein